MSVFVCPNCGHHHSLFGSDGAQKLSTELGVELLGIRTATPPKPLLHVFIGDVPLDVKIRRSCDQGSPITLSSQEENNAIVSTTYNHS